MLSIDATEITMTWPMPTAGTGGGNPPTGYQVYMFPGVAINTLASPVTVFKDIQVVATSVNTGQVPLLVSNVKLVPRYASLTSSGPPSPSPHINPQAAGTFALGFRGAMTVDLNHDASASDVKVALQV